MIVDLPRSYARRLRAVRRLAVVPFAATLAITPLAAERPEPSGPADFAARQAAWERHRELDDTSLFRGLEWRNVGPVVQGGRAVDIESVPGQPYTFYVAYASGGLWRTTNNGVTFEPLFDDQPAMIMGDVEIDPQNPGTLWVGTGENNSSRSSYGGYGVYRSDDAGESWRHMGLGESDRIGRIRVDPRDSARVYVASLGKLYTPGGERGVYRTTDGGASWQQVLAGDEVTGFVDLALDPSNPDVLYAAAWERSRRPWDFVESGKGSGVWKSIDGGDTWTRLGGANGTFPSGEHVGRIGLAVSASQPSTIYASLDNQELLPEELWDLGDGAVTAKRLRKMTKEDFLAQDPEEIEDFIRGSDLDSSLDAEKLIEMIKNDELTLDELLQELDDANANLFNTDIRSIEVWRSDDAGATWRRTHEEPIRRVVYTYGYYFGRIRVAPDDPDRIYVLGVPLITSGDGGKTFEGINGRGVHVDHQSFWIDPNFTDRVIVGNDGGLDVSYDGGKSWLKLDAQPVGQFYTVEVDMAEPYNIYGGLQDNGVLKGSSRSRPGLDPWRRIGGGDGMYIQVDPRDNQTTYLGLQFGFYFRIGGEGGRRSARPRDKLKEPALRYNWATPILLSEHNSDILYFGANRLYRSLDQGETWRPISSDLTRSENRGDVPYGTLTTLAESPEEFGLLWAGTDDGYVHVTDDGGREWMDVSDGLPRDRWVTRVEASRHERDRAYVSLSGYRDDDVTPYLYVTEDLGATWTSIAAGLPAEPVNVVREDPVNPDVLYVGTDRGAYASLDRGASWQGLPAGMPNVPVHDLIVHPRDRELVAATHGRSMYVLDALPVQELTPELRESAVHVFPVEPVEFDRAWRGRRSQWFEFPEDEPSLKVPFWTSEDGRAELIVRDGEGRDLQHLELEAAAGVATFTWDLLLDEAMALAAEKARLEDEDGGDEEEAEKKRRKKKKKNDEDTEEAAAEGDLANTPWAEAVRLDRPLYVTPGSYTLVVRTAGGEAETGLEVEKPEPRKPRMKKEPKIRGQKDD
ncbi:MAG: glycosyl hydrolase [bacterium]|nr:glycosyl hydrolase [bacterium]